MNIEVKPNFKNAGPVFGPKVKLYQEYLKSMLKKQKTGCQKVFNQLIQFVHCLLLRVFCKQNL